MHGRIAVLPGDGIGPEVIAEGVKVLEAVGERFGHRFECTEALIGGCAIDATGQPLPAETLDLCRQADAVLFGAVGGPKWSGPSAKVRPEQGLLELRKALDLFANLRPVRVYPGLVDASTLRPEVITGVDLVIVRELTGGLYFGKPQEQRATPAGREAVDTLFYTEAEVERLMRVAFELARQRANERRRTNNEERTTNVGPSSFVVRPKVTSVDKANVLASSRLWREVAHEVASNYPDVEYEDLLVDACAMHLIRRPGHFDVIATENMFGDILSDEASMLAGSLGMLPSASLAGWAGSQRGGLYEPIHGTAPDIAGQGVANPVATILTVAMMLRLAFGLESEAVAVEAAVEAVLGDGYRTVDIMQPGMRRVGTQEMGAEVVRRIRDSGLPGADRARSTLEASSYQAKAPSGGCV
jgi:3-isopropylmalate dehydrogenase